MNSTHDFIYGKITALDAEFNSKSAEVIKKRRKKLTGMNKAFTCSECGNYKGARMKSKIDSICKTCAGEI